MVSGDCMASAARLGHEPNYSLDDPDRATNPPWCSHLQSVTAALGGLQPRPERVVLFGSRALREGQELDVPS